MSHCSGVLECSHEECDEVIADSRWAKTKSGWFLQKDGSAWCVKHTPEWVIEWRARKAEEATRKAKQSSGPKDGSS